MQKKTKIGIGHNKPPKKKTKKIKKAKLQDEKLLNEFIFKLLPMEQMLYHKIAGNSGTKIYQFIKWKRGMMKENGWITMSNVEMRKHGWGMNRETKSLALYKLNQAQLITINIPGPGFAIKAFRPDIRGEYDGRKNKK